MRKHLQRMECPACLGVAMERVSVAAGVEVDHCGRCGGTWIPRDQAPRLRQVPVAALRATITRHDEASFLCHGCHAAIHRDAPACEACSWANTLDCPDCGKPMRRESAKGVTLDVCRPCKAVWLDHHELDAIWAVAAAGALAGTTVGGRIAAAGGDAGGFLLESLWWAPDLTFHAAYGAARVAGAGIDAASHAPEMLAALPDAAGGLAEAAGEAAGGVFSLIAEIIGGIFEGLG
jgi:Zn-finger nucleic acid-binding protein